MQETEDLDPPVQPERLAQALQGWQLPQGLRQEAPPTVVRQLHEGPDRR